MPLHVIFNKTQKVNNEKQDPFFELPYPQCIYQNNMKMLFKLLTFDVLHWIFSVVEEYL